MKKLFVLGFALCAVFAFTSCKTSQSEYKKAYDQAQQLELAQGQGQADEPIEIAPVASTTTSAVETNLDTTYHTEKVVLASGNASSLKEYSVVCGSYGKKEGAEKVRAELVGEGYDAIIVQNPNGLYRVICASYDSRSEAAEARARFKVAHPNNADYQKAWLLYNN